MREGGSLLAQSWAISHTRVIDRVLHFSLVTQHGMGGYQLNIDSIDSSGLAPRT